MTREERAYRWKVWLRYRAACPECHRKTTLMRGQIHSIESSGRCAVCHGTAVTGSAGASDAPLGKMFADLGSVQVKTPKPPRKPRVKGKRGRKAASSLPPQVKVAPRDWDEDRMADVAGYRLEYRDKPPKV